jgi:1-deoxy-D-xylulose-5-phosphate reductoisomerase
MNKGLELIEAYHLFAVEPAQLEVVVHPQSIVHALVGFRDGSMLAQLADPDMRTPVALGLSWPARIDTPTRRIDLIELGTLSFERPDVARFPALALARQVMEAGGMAPMVLNAANEVAVEAFLAGRIAFLEIAELVAAALDKAGGRGLLGAVEDVAGVLAADTATRQMTQDLLEERVPR